MVEIKRSIADLRKVRAQGDASDSNDDSAEGSGEDSEDDEEADSVKELPVAGLSLADQDQVSAC